MSTDLEDPETYEPIEAEVELSRGSGIALAVWSVLGLFAAMSLSIDKVKMLQDPAFRPGCDLNPVLACGSVMSTDQAQAFGFPNPFLGLVGFSVTLTLGLLVVSRVRVPTWMVVGGALGSVLGAVMVHWLAFQSLYRIGALCPWCLVVWAVTIPMALWLTLAAIGRLGGERSTRVAAAVWRWRLSLVAAWYLAVFVLVLIRFWSYWSTLL